MAPIETESLERVTAMSNESEAGVVLWVSTLEGPSKHDPVRQSDDPDAFDCCPVGITAAPLIPDNLYEGLSNEVGLGLEIPSSHGCFPRPSKSSSKRRGGEAQTGVSVRLPTQLQLFWLMVNSQQSVSSASRTYSDFTFS